MASLFSDLFMEIGTGILGGIWDYLADMLGVGSSGNIKEHKREHIGKL